MAFSPIYSGISAKNVSTALNQMDAAHYTQVAQLGYAKAMRLGGTSPEVIATFPLYPLVVSLLNYLVSNIVLSAIIVSFVASVVAGFFLQELVWMDFDEQTTKAAVEFFMFFPTAYFLALPYI